jgi:heme-degrading monooxygenase HmoA
VNGFHQIVRFDRSTASGNNPATQPAGVDRHISHKGYTAEDGERCTIVEFESEETQLAWRVQPEHLAAQRAARDLYYYETYNLQICEVKRQSKFDRNARSQAAAE